MNIVVRKQGSGIDAAALSRRAAELRGKVIEMSHAAQAAHLASSLSCADIVTAAYWHVLNSIRRSRRRLCATASSCRRATQRLRFMPRWQ
jgi:transketolase N-terminal domain/subunit